MGEMIEPLVAGTVVVVVAGAIVGMVFRLLWGNKNEDETLEQIAAKYEGKKKK